MERSSWARMPIVALLLCWVNPLPCVAESPPPTASAASVGRLETRPEAAALTDLPPSTVSPAIERFVKSRGLETRQQILPSSPSRPRSAATSNGRSPARSASAVGSSARMPRLGEAPRVASAGEVNTPSSRTTPQPPAVAPMNIQLAKAPLEPTDHALPINLATALRLADARPLVVAAAQAGVWVAEAQLTRAKVLWVPSIMFGLDYIRHDGGGPDVNKGIMTAPSVNYFYGGPSFFQYLNITDAIYEPLVARRSLDAAHYDIQTAKNDVVLQTSDAYFRVHRARGKYAGALYTVERGHDLMERISQLSKELVPVVEVDRARNMVADLEQLAVKARQDWRVESANLTQVLRLDPRSVIEPVERDHTQVTLIDPGRELDELMVVALNNRPELGSRRASLEAAEYRVRREKLRPMVPAVILNGFQSAGMLLQGGMFAIGPNGGMQQWRGRGDVTIQLMWQLENFGMGNLARIKTQRGKESEAIIEFRHAQDMVVADVTRALARVQSAAARVLQADRALRTAIITFNGHLEGLGQTRRLENVLILTYRPQEAVYSLEQLNVSFDEYFTTVADYNRAQFELFHALGYPAQEVTTNRNPGPVMDIDTSRPTYLPPVGTGPPPATR